MKTIIYKKRLDTYECVKINDGGGNDFKMIFDEPTDGKLTVGTAVFDVKDGVATGSLSLFGEGEIRPTLYCGGKLFPLEPFIASHGALLLAGISEEYVRRLGEYYEILAKRVHRLEAETDAINEKINQPLKF